MIDGKLGQHFFALRRSSNASVVLGALSWGKPGAPRIALSALVGLWLVAAVQAAPFGQGNPGSQASKPSVADHGTAARTFSIPVFPPTLSSSPTITSITGNSAILGGHVFWDPVPLVDRGVVYSETATNSNPLLWGAGVIKVTVEGQYGLFAAKVSGLTPLTGYSFKAFAKSQSGWDYSDVATFTTTCLTTITMASLPGGTWNAAYAASVTASGGTGPYTYGVSGSLPYGLSLTASGAGAGTVSGTPTTSGTFTFYITATDTSGAGTCTGTRGYSVNIVDPAQGQDFFTLSPCRVLDTRLHGPALAALTDRGFTVVTACGIPADATALSVNIAVTGPSNPGSIRIHAAGAVVPLASAIDYMAGQTRSNNAVIPMGSGSFAAYLDQAIGTAHLIVDVNGYFK